MTLTTTQYNDEEMNESEKNVSSARNKRSQSGEMCGETLCLRMIARRSNSHSVGFPFFGLRIEIMTRRRVKTKFVVRAKRRSLISQRRNERDGRRTGLIHFRGIQFSKAEDQRVMIEGLLVAEEEGVKIIVGQI